jgi:hypothetical protein
MNRRTFITQCALGSAGVAALVQGCQPTTERGAALAADPDGGGAVSASGGEASPLERPAIDQAPPARFETATFALG